MDHDLILTPFVVLLKMESRTVISITSDSFEYRPRLPMLIPWPGPHWTLVMLMALLPGPMEMQSSPVLNVEFVMLMLVDLEMWIPSVLGLSFGATNVRLSNLMFWLSYTEKWKNLLFIDLMFCIVALLIVLNFKLCIH